MLQLQAIYFGQKHADFDYKDMDIIKKVKRLARKDQRQCVNSCNGVGYVGSQCYYGGQIDDYARREYGQSIKSAYIGNSEDSIFDKESSIMRAKIRSILMYAPKFNVDFQSDPRGATVKLYYEGDYIELS